MSMDTSTPASPSENGHYTTEIGGFTATSTDPIGDVSDFKDHKGNPIVVEPAAKSAKTADGAGKGQPAPAPKDKPATAPAPASATPADPKAAAGKKGGEATAAIRRYKARTEAAEGDEVEAEPKEAAAEGAPVEGDTEDDPETAGQKAKDKLAKEIEAAKPNAKKQLASDRVREATAEAARVKRALAAAEQHREQLIRENEELRRRASSPQPAAAPNTPPASAQPKTAPAPRAPISADPNDPEPKEADYEKYEDFYNDHDRWTARSEARAQVEAAREEMAHEQQKQAYAHAVVNHHRAFEARVREAIAEDPGLDDENVMPSFLAVIRGSSYTAPDGTQLTPNHCINDAIIKSQNPTLLMTYLRAEPEQARRILALPSRAAISDAMTRLEARLEALIEAEGRYAASPSAPTPANGSGGATPGAPPPAPRSKANPPMRPVVGSPATVSGEYVEGQTTLDDYYRANKQKIREHLARL